MTGRTVTDKTLYAQDIVNALDFFTVASFYGVQFDNKGHAICPFHKEKTPSFAVQHKKFGHCFGCGWNGTVISFVMQYFELSFGNALIKLNDDFSLGLPLGRTRTVAEQIRDAKRRRVLETEQNRLKAEKEAYNKLYWELWDEWIAYDTIIRTMKPTTPDEQPKKAWLHALRSIGCVKYRIETEL